MAGSGPRCVSLGAWPAGALSVFEDEGQNDLLVALTNQRGRSYVLRPLF